VVSGEEIMILIFYFFLYFVVYSKDGLWWSRSKIKDEICDVKNLSVLEINLMKKIEGEEEGSGDDGKSDCASGGRNITEDFMRRLGFVRREKSPLVKRKKKIGEETK